MKTLRLFITLMAAGCGSGRPDDTAVVMPDFTVYVSMFEADVGVSAAGVDIIFEPKTLPTVAECRVLQDGKKTIHVDPEYWAESDDASRQWVIYHELGHCVLRLKHNIEQDGECPTSVMYPSNSKKDTCFSKYKEYYVEELKSHKAEKKETHK